MSAVDMPQVQSAHGTATNSQSSIQISSNYNNIFNIGAHVRELVITNSNSNSGTLTWTASTNDSWIGLQPATGEEGEILEVTVWRSALDVGSHTGNVHIGSNGGTKDITVNVTILSEYAVLVIRRLQDPYDFGYASMGLSFYISC